MPDSDIQAKQMETSRMVLICVALAATTFVAFEGVRNNNFVDYDDEAYVTHNTPVQRGLNFDSVAWAFTCLDVGNWHPMTWLSHMFDCTLFGVNPAWHHLVSVGFHIANVILLFLILKKMTGAFWSSAFVAAVFGLHPLAVESVAWAAERKNVLSTFFGFLTIAAYFRYAQKPGVWRYLVIALLFAAGLLSKPMLVTLPFVLILLDYWPIGRFEGATGWFWLRRAAIEKLPLLLMSAASCVITYIAQANSKAITDSSFLPLNIRLDNALISYVKYIGEIFCPTSLAVLYPLDLHRPAIWQTSMCLLLLVLVSSSAVMLRHRCGWLFAGWFWYLGTLVPVIGLVQVGMQSMADRYTYWPGIGIYIIVTWLAGQAGAKWKVPKVVLWTVSVLILGILLMMTRTQVCYWKNSLSLYEHTLAITENNCEIDTNYGELLRKAGHLDEAISHLKRAIAVNPDIAKAHSNMGIALKDKGLFTEAAAEFERSLKINPNSSMTHNYYGIMLAEHEVYDKAVEQFIAAMTPGRHFSGILDNLYNSGIKAGKLDVVLDVIKNWESKTPNNAELYYKAGMIYGMQGNTEKSIEQLEKALEIAKGQNDKELAKEVEEQLSRYRQKNK